MSALPADVEERSLAQLAAELAEGQVSSAALVAGCLERIDALDRSGPCLNAVISINPAAAAEAMARDAERKAGRVRGPLHGLPLLVKDNIETADETPTTAGSLALLANVSGVDAPVVRRLREAGAIILGKTNLSEWANIRCSRSISGWSAVGGLVRNPYALDRSAGGSSSGTGAAIAASLAPAGVGTETDGSIVCPAAFAGLVGLKPTVGLLSRSRIVPISASQDTPGPMTRTVADAALMLSVMAGGDPADAATLDADERRTDYLAAVAGASLAGRRLGVLRYAVGLGPAVERAFEAALELLRAEGAEVLETAPYEPPPTLGEAERLVLFTELKAGLDAYLASTPAAVRTRSLADLIAFNRATPRELCLFGQDTFERAEAGPGLDDDGYLQARASSLRMAGAEGIDRLLGAQRLDALIAPSYGPPGRIDAAAGDRGAGRSSQLAAVAGYPHLTVPMGETLGLPLGLSFIGPAWSEARLLGLGAAFEGAAGARRKPGYAPSVEQRPELAAAFAPLR